MKRLSSLVVMGFSFLLMAVSVVNAGVSSNTLTTILGHYAEIEKILKEGGNKRQFIGYLNESAERFLEDDFDTTKDLLSEALAFLQEMDKYLRKPGTCTNVRRWAGTGTKTTELFEIYGKEWVLKWQGCDMPHKIFIYKVDGSEMVLVNSFHESQGVETVHEGGVFCLKIVGSYKWTVYVDVKN